MFTRRTGLLVLGVALLAPVSIPATGFAAGAAAAAAAAEPTLDTPEEAVDAYIAGIAATDLDTVLATAGIEQRAAGFDFEAYVNRVKAFNPTTTFASTDSPFGIEINESILTGRAGQAAQLLSWSLLVDTPLEPRVTPVDDPAWSADFLATTDPSQLTGLTVVDVREPDAEIQASERYLEVAGIQAAIWGADEQVERVALVSLGDSHYVVPFTLLRYDDSWVVADLSSPISNVAMGGFVSPITPEEFAATFGG